MWLPRRVDLEVIGRVVSGFVRNVFARESLGPEPAPAPRRARRRGGLARTLLAPEPLEAAPAAAPAPDRPGLLRLLFAPEPLPRDPPLPPRGRGRWLAWIFAPEPLDPP